jgi:hypothetical protein
MLETVSSGVENRGTVGRDAQLVSDSSESARRLQKEAVRAAALQWPPRGLVAQVATF